MAIESSQFIDSKKQKWQSLSKLLEKVSIHGFRKLSTKELNSLGKLYREISSDLAFARTHLHDVRLTHYLNNLIAKAHGYIYQTKPARFKAIWHFYCYHFPYLFKKTIRFTLSALLIFIFFALVGLLTTAKEESFSTLLLPPSLLNSLEKKEMWTNDITSVAPLASSKIMTNNISVTFSAFALGITCIGTFYIIALNGLVLGVIIYLVTTNGMSLDFWSFVLPHGIIELTCIFIAGGAGLILGSSLLLPGELKRKCALILRAKIAVKLIIGCIPALICAGIIEAFISGSFLDPMLKLAFALLASLLFFLYLLTPRKRANLDSELKQIYPDNLEI